MPQREAQISWVGYKTTMADYSRVHFFNTHYLIYILSLLIFICDLIHLLLVSGDGSERVDDGRLITANNHAKIGPLLDAIA